MSTASRCTAIPRSPPPSRSGSRVRKSLLVPGRGREIGRDGLGHGRVGPDFGNRRRNAALPGVEVRHQRSALAHHNTALVTGQAAGAAIPLAPYRHRFVADLQRLPDPDGCDPIAIIVTGALL